MRNLTVKTGPIVALLFPLLILPADPAAAQDFRYGGYTPRQYQPNQPSGDFRPSSEFPQGQLALMRQRADELDLELDYLIESVPRGDQQLDRDLDQVADSLAAFRQAIGPEARRQPLYGLFHAFDSKLHGVLNKLGSSGGQYARNLSRISAADQQLHASLVQGDRSPAAVAETLARLSHAIDAQTRDLVALVRQRRGPGTEPLEAELNRFASSVAHYHEVAERADDPWHTREDFKTLQSNWRPVVQRINSMQGNSALRKQALRVDALRLEISDLVQAGSPQGPPPGTGVNVRPGAGIPYEAGRPNRGPAPPHDHDRDRGRSIDIGGGDFGIRLRFGR